MIPSFDVPAQYFYALTATMPPEVDAGMRYRLSCLADEKQIVSQLKKAIEDGVITADPVITPEMAARRMRALGSAQGPTPTCASGVGLALVQAYVAHKNPAPDEDPAQDIAPFWVDLMVNPARSAERAAHLELVLCAVTQEADSRPLINDVHAEGITLDTVKDLDPKPWGGPPPQGMSYGDWHTVFTAHPNRLPAITAPGTIEERIGAFIRRLRKFFEVAAFGSGPDAPVFQAPSHLALPQFDPIASFLGAYIAQPGGAGFTFGQPLQDALVDASLISVFPADARARAWLEKAIRAINELYIATDIGLTDALHFSLAEALYARGFTSQADIAALRPDVFRDALIGTPAYDYAGAIYTKAGGTGGAPEQPQGPFLPINADETLANCVPPPYTSPLGPIAYLHDLLGVATTATCDAPNPTGDVTTLGSLVSNRRGPLGDLHATRANLETPLPLVDLVNECLEAMVATGTPSGVVYDTAADVLAGHALRPAGTPEDGAALPYLHDAATLFATVPEHSSPATPIKLPDAYTKLASDFSAPDLPYAQSLDVCRTYLGALGKTRFSVMRHFRRDITEFVLDPTQEPTDFLRHVWRYPVRIEIAREYLGISPAEHAALFSGPISPAELATLYGFTSDEPKWIPVVLKVSEFLDRTGLTYCQFIELWRAGFVKFHRKPTRESRAASFPLCQPCYLDKETIEIEGPPLDGLTTLAVVIRLWRKLQAVHNAKYSFSELWDICAVLKLFMGNGSVNPDFIRQLAAFQMLRDDFALPLADETDPAPEMAEDRTHLLALWVGPSAKKWAWAVRELIEHIEHHGRKKHGCAKRPRAFLKLLEDNLDPLSLLAGFDPAVPAATWHARPTHTLRFAEVLSKLYASQFGIGEILYLFTADEHLRGDDPFRLSTDDEANDHPLHLPDDSRDFSLLRLRKELLSLDVSDEEARSWTWPRIEASLRDEFGAAAGAPEALLALAEHFFPEELERHGTSVPAARRRYQVPLAATTGPMWNTPADGPFHYDAGASELWTELPLRDEAVLTKIARLRPLSDAEQAAVRELYFMPRLHLASFALLFANFAEAARALIEEPDEAARWAYFQRAFARCRARCLAIAEHLAAHVDAAIGCEGRGDQKLAWRLLMHLLGDENRATAPPSWESDDGKRPLVTWGPQPNGSAFAALLGLVGTGLLGEFHAEGDCLVWRELRGPTDAFGDAQNAWNAPVPMILPSFDAELTDEQLRYAGVRNGIMLANASARRLGGAEGFCVTWRGVLLVDEGGAYRFWAGAPTPEGEAPSMSTAEAQRWRITLRRGQKSWVLLSHEWPGHEEICGCSAPLALKHGAYDLTIELVQRPPRVVDLEEERAQKTGFQLKYEGPDTGARITSIPFERLFLARKDAALASGLDQSISGAARTFLQVLYTSSLRDIRRTYQRAFKALLFARRFGLSAEIFADYGQSEIGLLLDNPSRFAGLSFYPTDAPFAAHRADFDLNLLPLLDNYHPPPTSQDDRVAPSKKRKQALFDLWERIFDYAWLREHARKAPEHPAWLLFDAAAQNQPDPPAQILRHIDVDLSYADLVLRYYWNYTVTSADLSDERWAIRVFRADGWVENVVAQFLFEDVRDARPDVWASDDPGVVEPPLFPPGMAVSGNANLTKMVRDGAIEQGPPRRYEDVQRLNDGLRERARRALLAYLCGMNRVALPWGGFAERPKQISELLLLDVEAGICQRASRIEEAVSAIQSFVQRARLGLEASFPPSPEFVTLWERRFAMFRTWEACARRALYRENWIEYDALEKARHTEAFRFLEDQLRRATLTVPAPGGLEWWNAERPPEHPGLVLLQARSPSTIARLAKPREGLNLLGTPAPSGRRSWLSSVPLSERDDDNDDDVPTDRPRDDVPSLTHVPANTTSPRRRRRGRRGRASRVEVSAHAVAQPRATGTKLPLWLEAAIRLGARFLRVAAAGEPPASLAFEPLSHATGCCRRCGKTHEASVDEFYFWLFDTRWYEQKEQVADWTGWHEAVELPRLLDWQSNPMVHLMWARIHHGEIEQPRRSIEGVRIIADAPPGSVDLELDGRTFDSLKLRVVGGETPTGYAGSPLPGFRYDLATDTAAVVPGVVAEPPAAPALDVLAAYPYFAYFEPGAPLFPLEPFSEAMTVAATLRAHCRFEAALKWYEVAFAPLRSDVRWCPEGRTRVDHPHTHPSTESAPLTEAVEMSRRDACCKHAAVPDAVAEKRAVTLAYLETLFAWGDSLMRKNTPEAFQQARLVFDTAASILGPTPITVEDHEPPTKTPPKVSAFIADGAPLNPRLISLYERVADRLSLIHTCLNQKRLRGGRPNIDMLYFGDDRARDGWQMTTDVCADEQDGCCVGGSPYRFLYLVQKANELAAEVRGLGAALLAAFEKGDAEYLAYVRAGHERQLLTLAREIRMNQWREADWQVQALKKTKEIAQTKRLYYSALITAGLNAGELDYEGLMNGGIGAYTAATVSEAVATVLGIIPDVFVGTTSFVQLPIGSKLANVFSGIARISTQVGQILTTTANLRLTQGGWDRREQEWHHQVEVLDIEIEQIERQILAAERRRDTALLELHVQQRQIENAGEVLDILRDKFTNHQLYLWMAREVAAIYYQTYELARCTARQAERAFNHERGHTTRRFVPVETWDNLHEGLLAGERLSLAVRRMEKAYLDEDSRVYELTKHVSLRLCFAPAFLALKLTGQCIVELPEWLFDLDYPGHYMRRIKNVSLTIPCVVGPYVGVHCRLTLLSSATRIDPRLRDPVTVCCKEEPPRQAPRPACSCWPSAPPKPRKVRQISVSNGYTPASDDPRIVKQYAATEAIATSSGQNDAGMFEVSFRDERYLPFEFAGAVSRWRIELPPENNYFDMDSLSDLILHLNYTARDGGDVLRRAANEVARAHIPDDGRRLLDMKRELPAEWRHFQAQGEGKGRWFELKLGRDHFPFLPGDRGVTITRVELFVEAEGAAPSTHQEVELSVTHQKHCGYFEVDEHEFQCVGGSAWQGVYHGAVDVRLGPLHGTDEHRLGVVRFEEHLGKVTGLFLLLHYETL